MADHGYHVGEHDLWAKTSNFELDARVPLIICPPKHANAGKATSSLVELVDLFPTLNELCELKAIAGLDGVSLKGILDDPKKALKTAAFTQHPRPAYPDRTEKGVPDAMGYSVRTERVRYTEWRDWETGTVIGRELYAHSSDPGEMRNVVDLAKDPLVHARDLLHEQFPTIVPPAKR
jgi:iduronate 2-sulfatase